MDGTWFAMLHHLAAILDILGNIVGLGDVPMMRYLAFGVGTFCVVVALVVYKKYYSSDPGDEPPEPPAPAPEPVPVLDRCEPNEFLRAPSAQTAHLLYDCKWLSHLQRSEIKKTTICIRCLKRCREHEENLEHMD